MSRFVKLTYYCSGNQCCFSDIRDSKQPSVVVNQEQIVSLGPEETWGHCEGFENYPFRRLSLTDGETYLLPIETAYFLERILFINKQS